VSNAPAGHARLILLLGSLTAIAPMSIDMYLPAFTALQETFRTDAAAVQRTLSVFFIGLSIGQLFYGPLSDAAGRKPAAYVGLALFIAGSLLALLSRAFPMMLAARLLQGIGGGFCGSAVSGFHRGERHE
jgi:DHA1 family bicyclomycin/chloramphenicol resistance-like MFS transporter